MLSKRKKRIAALLTAVVLSVTAAFSLPENIRAEEVTATNSDADAEATTEEGLQEDGIAVQDIGDTGETVYIHSRYWDGWVIADYVNVTATDYTPTLHGALVAKDASGRETEAYCMQSTKSSAQYDAAYKEGKQGISVHCINTMPQIPLVGVFPNPPEKNNTKCSCRCSIGTMNKKFTLNCVK